MRLCHTQILCSAHPTASACAHSTTRNTGKKHIAPRWSFVNVMSLASNQDILWIWYFVNHQQTYNPPDPTQMTDYSTQLCACPVTTTPSPSDDTELTPWQSCSSRCRSSRKRVISHASMGTLTVTWNVLLIRSASAMHVGMFPWITSFLASSTHSASRPADFRRRFRPPIPTSRLKSPTDSK